MYKSRITKWGLDKNMKEADAKAILRKKMERDSAGKESAFRVRGKSVTIGDVHRYFRRKDIMNPSVEARSPRVSTPSGVTCWTPLSSPRARSATIEALEEGGVRSETTTLNPENVDIGWEVGQRAEDGIWGSRNHEAYSLTVEQVQQILFSIPQMATSQIPHSPIPPQSLAVSEKLFASIRSYYAGAFDSGIFQTSRAGWLFNVNAIAIKDNIVFEFYELCITGATLMDSGSFLGGRRCFSKASGLVPQLVRGQHPRALERILDTFMALKKGGYDEISIILRTLVSGIAANLFAKEHPWRQLLSHLSSLEDLDFKAAITEAMRCISESLVSTLGQFHRTALDCYTVYLNRKQNSLHLFHDLSIRGEREPGKLDDRLLSVKLQYGKALYYQNRYTEAAAIAEGGIVLYREIGGQDGLEITYIDLLSLCHYHLGHKAAAESRLREAIEKHEGAYGKSNSLTLRLKSRLETWLRNWGREEEVPLFNEEMEDILGPDDIEV